MSTPSFPATEDRSVPAARDLVLADVAVEYGSGVASVRPVNGFSCTIPDGSLALLLGPSEEISTSPWRTVPSVG